jgi:ketosteroid isomerase-like protein
MNSTPHCSPRFRCLIVAAIAAVIAPAISIAANPPAPVASKAEVEKVFGKFVQAWNQKDLNAVMASFMADAVAFDPSGPGRFENTEGIRAWAADTFKTVEGLAIELRDLRVHTAGSVAWLTASYVFKGKVQGNPMSEPGNVSMVWVKQGDGTYKSPVFHASPIPKPAAPLPAAAAK